MLQLSVQQEGEADMDVELLRKGLLAVKLKGEEEEEGRNKKGRGGKGGAAGCASADAEEEAGLAMPGVWTCVSARACSSGHAQYKSENIYQLQRGGLRLGCSTGRIL